MFKKKVKFSEIKKKKTKIIKIGRRIC